MKIFLLIIIVFSLGFLSAHEESNIVLVDENFKNSDVDHDYHLFAGIQTGYFLLEQDSSAPPFYDGRDSSSERTEWIGNGFTIGVFGGLKIFRFFQLSFEFAYEPIHVEEHSYEYNLNIYNLLFVPEFVIPIDSLHITLNFSITLGSYNITRENGYTSKPKEDSEVSYDKRGSFTTVGIRGGADFSIGEHFFIGFRASSKLVLISGNSQDIVLLLGTRFL